jgi:hypothetical protein
MILRYKGLDITEYGAKQIPRVGETVVYRMLESRSKDGKFFPVPISESSGVVAKVTHIYMDDIYFKGSMSYSGESEEVEIELSNIKHKKL